MSDDEEIICKGQSLYNHLVDIGYADFETFVPNHSSLVSVKPLQFNFSNCDPAKDCKNSLFTTKLSFHDKNKLLNILNSKLLFNEDAHLIESYLQNAQVYNKRQNLVYHSSAVMFGLLSSIIMFKHGISPYVPLSITSLFTFYFSWKCFKEFKETTANNILESHTKTLKNVCSSVFRLLRFIKETEILSSSHISVHNVGSAMFCPVSKYTEKELSLETMPVWRTLPHLRKSLLDSLIDVVNVLTESRASLQQSFPSEVLYVSDLNPVRESIKAFETISNSEQCVSVRDLQNLSDTYLVVQSEYLKEVALVFLSVFWRKSLKVQNNTKKDVLKLVAEVDPNLDLISYKLNMQYNIHNISSSSSSLIARKKPLNKETKEVNEMQVNIHNIFLLLYSTLLRIRSLEDYLENVSETDVDSKLTSSITEQLSTLKDDLLSTVKYYDMMCLQIMSKKKLAESELCEGNAVYIKEEIKVKETGIEVGASDYSLNAPDEVFLAVSDLTNEEMENSVNIKDWELELKPQLPKSLLTELSKTLKSRKMDFVEREKQALKRQGLEDIEHNSNVSEEGSEESDSSLKSNHNRSGPKYRKHIPNRFSSHSSDSDDEMDPFEKGMYLTKLNSKRYKSETESESDVSSLEDQECNKAKVYRTAQSESFLSSSTVASLVANKSHAWRKVSEECYSDGSDS